MALVSPQLEKSGVGDLRLVHLEENEVERCRRIPVGHREEIEGLARVRGGRDETDPLGREQSPRDDKASVHRQVRQP